LGTFGVTADTGFFGAAVGRVGAGVGLAGAGKRSFPWQAGHCATFPAAASGKVSGFEHRGQAIRIGGSGFRAETQENREKR
jgi:hypothetical protein